MMNQYLFQLHHRFLIHYESESCFLSFLQIIGVPKFKDLNFLLFQLCKLIVSDLQHICDANSLY